jgi:membrane protease YdiL (CAAX protease family)
MPAVEALIVLALTLPLAVGFGAPTLWFVVPFAIVTLLGRPYEEYGLTLRNPGPLRFHAAVCLIVFGTYALVHYGFARVVLGLAFHPTLAPDLPELALEQLLVVGLSEELFFRGYLQTQLNRVFGRPYRFLGASWGLGLPAAALLFGLCHLVHGDVTRIRTALFGLLVGWLRERTDTIAVPAAYHGFANLLYDFMQRSMR